VKDFVVDISNTFSSSGEDIAAGIGVLNFLQTLVSVTVFTFLLLPPTLGCVGFWRFRNGLLNSTGGEVKTDGIRLIKFPIYLIVLALAVLLILMLLGLIFGVFGIAEVKNYLAPHPFISHIVFDLFSSSLWLLLFISLVVIAFLAAMIALSLWIIKAFNQIKYTAVTGTAYFELPQIVIVGIFIMSAVFIVSFITIPLGAGLIALMIALLKHKAEIEKLSRL
jgi:hypothetical protein